jgi:hypothetical protein
LPSDITYGDTASIEAAPMEPQMTNTQTFYFPADGSRVLTGMCNSGMFGAHLVDDDRRARGYGHTRLAAIAALNEELNREESEGEDFEPIAEAAPAMLEAAE